ncbi:MAG: DUF1295 domain-containing protein [Candidatus Woesearchaeota archaeon]
MDFLEKIESFSDFQKLTFKKQPKNKGRFIKSGLWKYSRHPNYFGEILCWIGVYVFCGVWMWGLISPIFITTMLLFVSGIPLLEKKADEKWGGSREYQKYKHETPILIPWKNMKKKV